MRDSQSERVGTGPSPPRPYEPADYLYHTHKV